MEATSLQQIFPRRRSRKPAIQTPETRKKKRSSRVYNSLRKGYALFVNFPTQDKKATQAVARVIQTSCGPIDYLRIVKLVYLADRESILKRGVPIVGGHYYSMRLGPTISEVMDFVHSRKAPQWRETISPRFGNEVRLSGPPDFGALSKSELNLLDSVVEAHSERTTEELVEWCHENCPEYQRVQSGRKPIEVESILRAAKKSARQIKKVLDEAKTIQELDELLSAGRLFG